MHMQWEQGILAGTEQGTQAGNQLGLLQSAGMHVEDERQLHSMSCCLASLPVPLQAEELRQLQEERDAQQQVPCAFSLSFATHCFHQGSSVQALQQNAHYQQSKLC